MHQWNTAGSANCDREFVVWLTILFALRHSVSELSGSVDDESVVFRWDFTALFVEAGMFFNDDDEAGDENEMVDWDRAFATVDEWFSRRILSLNVFFV